MRYAICDMRLHGQARQSATENSNYFPFLYANHQPIIPRRSVSTRRLRDFQNNQDIKILNVQMAEERDEIDEIDALFKAMSRPLSLFIVYPPIFH
jgi:hypothetical protein